MCQKWLIAMNVLKESQKDIETINKDVFKLISWGKKCFLFYLRGDGEVVPEPSSKLYSSSQCACRAAPVLGQCIAFTMT